MPIIRPPDLADSKEIAQLLSELGYPALPREVEARLGRFAAGSSLVLVADADGSAVGLATAQIWRALHVEPPTAWLTALVVGSQTRRLGVGRMLVEAVEAWAGARGCLSISLLSGLSRADAHQFYERLGYRQTGRRFTKPLGVR
jgi:GNAT superfamily N-acetyltransferase